MAVDHSPLFPYTLLRTSECLCTTLLLTALGMCLTARAQAQSTSTLPTTPSPTPLSAIPTPGGEPLQAKELPKMHAPFATDGCQKPVRVNFFGDVFVNQKALAASQDLFAPVAPLLKWADFNIVNFESVVSEHSVRAFPEQKFALKSEAALPRLLANAGIRHVTRANNHSMDFGVIGMNDTSRALNAQGIRFAGVGTTIKAASRPLTLRLNGTRIAVFSFTTTHPLGAWASEKRPGVAAPSEDTLKILVAAARATHDFVVTVFHWGQELSPELRPHQKHLAGIVLASGADLLLGHHAHIAQAIETSSGRTAAYGLGNFIFSGGDIADFSLAAHVEFCKNTASPPDSKPSVRVAFTPLDTLNTRTQYATRPMTLLEFRPFAKKYLARGLFSGDVPFFIPVEGQTRPLTEWVKPPEK